MRQKTDEELEKGINTVYKLVESFTDEGRVKAITTMLGSTVGTDFFSAPASTRDDYHSAYHGGLVDHSLNVAKNLKKLAETLAPGKYNPETLRFVALFHDLGKAGDGKEPYYVTQTSDWHRDRGEYFKINPDCAKMPVAERSIYLLQAYGISMSSEEFLAIRLSDGQADESNRPYRYHEPELALLLHWADAWSVREEKAK